MNLVNFNGKAIMTIGKIVLPINANGVTILSRMMVFDTPSTYNTIMGRPWLHTIKLVPSTLH